jgi:exodeoxyribonuclease-3
LKISKTAVFPRKWTQKLFQGLREYRVFKISQLKKEELLLRKKEVERELFKNFSQVYLNIINLQKQIQLGKSIILVGDYNVAHKEIDVYDPVRLSKESGFLPEERQWFGSFLDLGFIDTFRHFHPNDKAKYSWWSYRELARISNRGWRIDYICITKDLEKNLVSANILDQVEGSDHCPVVAEFNF